MKITTFVLLYVFSQSVQIFSANNQTEEDKPKADLDAIYNLQNENSLEINGEFKKINSGNKKINGNITRIEANTQELKGNITGIEANTEELKSNVTEMKPDMTEMKRNMTEIKELVTNRKVIDISKINVIKVNSLTHANEDLTNHPQLGLSPATNNHVIYKQKKDCYKDEIKFTLFDSNITPVPRDFYKHKNVDLALIPLEVTPDQEKSFIKHAATIREDKEFKNGEKLMEIGYYKKELNLGHGTTIVDFLEKSKMLIESNFSGAPGYSGCGYYDQDGLLSYIQKGPRNTVISAAKKANKFNKRNYIKSLGLTSLNW